MWILWVLLGLVALLLSVVLIRTAAFKPKKTTFNSDAESIEFDADEAVSALQQLLRCKTISYFDHSLEDEMRITIIAANFDSANNDEAKKEESAPQKKSGDFFDGMF